MGFRNRIKSKIKERIQDIRALAKVVQDEATHPGRPQPHIVARNPLWGGESGEKLADTPKKTAPQDTVQEAKSPISKPEQKASNSDDDSSDDEDFWYLRGDNEGWSDLNPGKP